MRQRGVTAVVVSYNVRDLLLQCMESLQVAVDQGVLSRVIVVDNDSKDGSAEAVQQHYPTASIIRSPNVGYGAGANRGMREVDTEAVLVLNPDTVVPADAISRLHAYLQNNEHVAIAGPRLRYPDGSIQSTLRRFPRRLTPIFESTIFEQWWPANPWVRAYRLDESPDARCQRVDWLVGACLMVRMDAIDIVDGFDESFWMYCEEIEWCWRFRRHGWQVAYVPDAEVIHHEGASSSQNIARRQLAFDRSRVELQRRMYGSSIARVCAAGIKAGYLAQLAIESGKFVAGHRRALRRARIKDNLRMIRASLLAGASVREP